MPESKKRPDNEITAVVEVRKTEAGRKATVSIREGLAESLGADEAELAEALVAITANNDMDQKIREAAREAASDGSSTTVGYSRAYADQFDSVFGKKKKAPKDLPN